MREVEIMDERRQGWAHNNQSLLFSGLFNCFYLCNPLPWVSKECCFGTCVLPLLTTSKSLLWVVCKKRTKKSQEVHKAYLINKLRNHSWTSFRMVFLATPCFSFWSPHCVKSHLRSGCVLRGSERARCCGTEAASQSPLEHVACMPQWAAHLDQMWCIPCLLSWYCGSWSQWTIQGCLSTRAAVSLWWGSTWSIFRPGSCSGKRIKQA